MEALLFLSLLGKMLFEKLFSFFPRLLSLKPLEAATALAGLVALGKLFAPLLVHLTCK